jgi:molybdopterin/thiamine biosynthesis adenylyltransferase
MGVFAPLVGIIGSTQAAEALKLLCSIGESLAGRLLMLDALHMRWSEMGARRASACKVCGSPADHAGKAP